MGSPEFKNVGQPLSFFVENQGFSKIFLGFYTLKNKEKWANGNIGLDMGDLKFVGIICF